MGTSGFDTLIGKSDACSPCAKLNIRLKVEGRGKDNLHLLSMINVLTSLCDDQVITMEEGEGIELYCEAAEELRIVQPHEVSSLQDGASNLAVRAAKAFLERFKVPLKLRIRMIKKIPIGAGLGGGAADAGAMLRSLVRLCAPVLIQQKRVAEEALAAECTRIALSVGADVPYFFRDCFARVTGVGEKVDRLDAKFLKGVKAVVVLPLAGGVIQPNSTKVVYDTYRAMHPTVTAYRDVRGEQYAETLRLNTEMEGYEPMPSKTIRAALWRQLIPLVENDLEEAAIKNTPVLKDILDRFRSKKEIVPSITGSGSALFILPRTQDWFALNGMTIVDELLQGIPHHKISVELKNTTAD